MNRSLDASNATFAAAPGAVFEDAPWVAEQAALVAEFRRRLGHDPASGRDAVLREIGYRTRLRLADQVIGVLD